MDKVSIFKYPIINHIFFPNTAYWGCLPLSNTYHINQLQPLLHFIQKTWKPFIFIGINTEMLFVFT
jgi:hypothetical protein